MPINLNGAARQAASNLAQAFAGDDTAAVEQGFVDLQTAIFESVRAEYEEAIASNDRAILAQRGFRQLTTEETDYYQSIIDALKSPNPKQAFADITTNGDHTLPEKTLPETIFNDILKNIAERHPLLEIIRPKSVGYITTWLRNKHTRQLAVWGEIETDITGEITSAFEAVSVRQGRLTCFMLIHRDTLALGPTFLDGYIRTVLAEAMACGMEAGVCTGKGIDGEPIGLDRDIHRGVSVNDTTGYPRKTAVAVKSFAPKEYGPLVAQLAKDELGHVKQSVGGLTLVCNLVDYLTKVMPATTVLNAEGRYVNDLFPVPTKVVTAEVIKEGEALLILPEEYDLLVAGNRGIEYSDEVKFFEDKRAAKMVTYAFGKAYDNTSALLLDISELDPAYITVLNVTPTEGGGSSDGGSDGDGGDDADGGDGGDGGSDPANPKLAGLSIGALTLDPAFDADVTEYAVTTSNATNTITATAGEGVTVSILVGETPVESGNAATWEEGENTVTVTASNGTESTVYTVTVTKE